MAFLLGRSRNPRSARMAVATLVVADLLAFGYDLNPAINPGDDRPVPPVIAYLRRECPPPARVIGIGAELPPNVLMRYGLADARNYDSIELGRNLDWLAPLYEPEPGRASRTSRRTILWTGILRGLDHLRAADVRAIVSATPPPEGAFERVDRVGSVWVARLSPSAPRYTRAGPAEIRLDLSGDLGQVRWVPETYDPGWVATVDGRPAAVSAYEGTFLAVEAPPGARAAVFRYSPARSGSR